MWEPDVCFSLILSLDPDKHLPLADFKVITRPFARQSGAEHEEPHSRFNTFLRLEVVLVQESLG